MRHAVWCLAGLALSIVLGLENRVAGQIAAETRALSEGLLEPDVFDVSIGGLSDCRAGRLARHTDPNSDHRQFLAAIEAFVKTWGTWRRTYNIATKTPDSGSRQQEWKLWEEVIESARALPQAKYAKERFMIEPEPRPLTPPEPREFHYAAWDFTSSWYEWLSRHITHTEKNTSDLEALRGDAVLFQESMRLFQVMEGLRLPAETP